VWFILRLRRGKVRRGRTSFNLKRKYLGIHAHTKDIETTLHHGIEEKGAIRGLKRLDTGKTQYSLSAFCGVDNACGTGGSP
jgi:hypothetical protein